ncbi:hypothetical protein H0H81_005143 [Sphagnurus paluster]|uniref:Uncharacterized protein n=1 Tax=Sphagnurus paluster TaxID=117069 RepID=A0A9P7GP98_9AGAR|nr:hypothetical protein H0H81_005143 [Sphagnurus paluster]
MPAPLPARTPTRSSSMLTHSRLPRKIYARANVQDTLDEGPSLTLSIDEIRWLRATSSAMVDSVRLPLLSPASFPFFPVFPDPRLPIDPNTFSACPSSTPVDRDQSTQSTGPRTD